MEAAPTRALFATPQHPCTQALLGAVPIPHPTPQRDSIILSGHIPSPIDRPPGCAFSKRCRHALPACSSAISPLREAAPGHFSACIRDDLALRAAALAP